MRVLLIKFLGPKVLEDEDMREAKRGDDESDDHARVDIELHLLLAAAGVARGACKGLNDEEKERRDELKAEQVEEGKSIPPVLLIFVSWWILQPHHQRNDAICCDNRS